MIVYRELLSLKRHPFYSMFILRLYKFDSILTAMVFLIFILGLGTLALHHFTHTIMGTNRSPHTG
jgi:hypothetical protein